MAIQFFVEIYNQKMLETFIRYTQKELLEAVNRIL